MIAVYRANYAGLGQILSGDRLAEVVTNHAEVIRDRARGLAPVQTGNYRDSIDVTSHRHGRRPVAHVGPHVPYGLVVESRVHAMRRSLG